MYSCRMLGLRLKQGCGVVGLKGQGLQRGQGLLLGGSGGFRKRVNA